MSWISWVAVALAALQGGYMLLDGARALVVGDYITPKSGPYAGRLGPWSNLVAVIGIEPRSNAMKLMFVTYGVAWLAIAVAFALAVPWAWMAMLIAAVGTLWYLVPGTAISVLVIGLLFVPGVRAG
ncbi:MAG TPA: hypothetical protein VHL78_04425 [Actinomycetota bacterium]|nr:hypothetical protein [Actinomycetota bacterium]